MTKYVIIQGGGATLRPIKEGETGKSWEIARDILRGIYRARVQEWRYMTEDEFMDNWDSSVASLLP
jgi:hypothetical protein|tara:strand:- start:99 stop:296 length:198 start_codon:yes stop_codon:yes gene_type:complete